MENYEVYTGHWVNYSLDGVGRSQWTLTAAQGGFLLAAVAAFVTLVGSQFWTIVSFIVHQCRASAGPHDGLHHVQQVVYRNSSPLAAAWTLFTAGIVYSGRLAWYWPDRVVEPYVNRRKRRGYFAAILPLAIWGAFVVAATFSSLVTRQTWDANEVKVMTSDCGFLTFDDMSDGERMLNFRKQTTKDARAALAYVDSCYNNTASTAGNLACKTLTQSQLNYEILQTDQCPFGNRCKVDPVIMDTHWMDSHTHFGINAPLEERVQFRKRTTCAVVDVSDLTESRLVFNDSTTMNAYYLGIGDNWNTTTMWSFHREPWDHVGYDVFPQFYIQGQSNYSTFEPIPDFNVTDGDVSVFLIAFGAMSYPSPIHDPLYSATTTLDDSGYYYSDSDAGIVACVDQIQVQSPDSHVQSKMAGLYQVFLDPDISPINGGFSHVQWATAFRLIYSVIRGEMQSAVFGLGAASLRAQRNAVETISTGLPENQWQQEVFGWFETTLSILQHDTVAFASKSPDSVSGNVNLTIEGLDSDVYRDALQNMCKNQKIRNVALYQSFSVNGVGAIFAIGGIIVLISLVIDSIGDWIPKMRRRADRWRTDSVLHLQRLAYQNAGQGAWERTRETIPAVRGGLDQPDRDAEETGYHSVRGSMSKVPMVSEFAQPSPSLHSPPSPQPPTYMQFNSFRNY